ncbi:MAG: ABC transporter substrate-binding protein [Nocardioides sp.]|uniref:ABC transporter substrate-binding protein n=1 Tax=Nocardioides sp. TaxID=35761 RepID=UPI0039E2395F
MVGRRIAAALMAAALGVALTACGSSTDTGTTAAGLTEVTVGVTPISNAAAVYLGTQQGFFEDEKIEVDVKTIQAASSAIPSLLKNQLQFALVSAVPTITAASKGLDIKIVTGNDRFSDDPETPDGAELVAAKGSGITETADLAGKTIAVVGLQSAPELAVRLALKKAGVDPSGVKFVEIAYPDMVSALESARVDAAVVVDPYLSQATQAGLKAVMEPFPEGLPGRAGTTWVASGNYLSDNADVAARFTSAMKKSVAYAAAHPAAVRKIMGTYTSISAADRKSAILPLFNSSVTKSDLTFYAKAMQQQGFLTKEYDASGLLWTP